MEESALLKDFHPFQNKELPEDYIFNDLFPNDFLPENEKEYLRLFRDIISNKFEKALKLRVNIFDVQALTEKCGISSSVAHRAQTPLRQAILITYLVEHYRYQNPDPFYPTFASLEEIHHELSMRSLEEKRKLLCFANWFEFSLRFVSPVATRSVMVLVCVRLSEGKNCRRYTSGGGRSQMTIDRWTMMEKLAGVVKVYRRSGTRRRFGGRRLDGKLKKKRGRKPKDFYSHEEEILKSDKQLSKEKRKRNARQVEINRMRRNMEPNPIVYKKPAHRDGSNSRQTMSDICKQADDQIWHTRKEMQKNKTKRRRYKLNTETGEEDPGPFGGIRDRPLNHLNVKRNKLDQVFELPPQKKLRAKLVQDESKKYSKRQFASFQLQEVQPLIMNSSSSLDILQSDNKKEEEGGNDEEEEQEDEKSGKKKRKFKKQIEDKDTTSLTVLDEVVKRKVIQWGWEAIYDIIGGSLNPLVFPSQSSSSSQYSSSSTSY